MSYQIVWSKDASDELIAIITYLKNEISIKKADAVYKQLRIKLDYTKVSPEAGRIVPELLTLGITEIRELIERPWRIFYKVSSNQEIRVLSIIDGRRNIEEILYKKVLEGKLI